MTRAGIVVALALLAGASACGSTADRSTTLANSAPVAPSPVTVASGTGAQVAPVAIAATGPVALDGPADPPPLLRDTTPAAACPDAAPGTPGVSSDELWIGSIRIADPGAVGALVGGINANVDEYVDALVAEINAAGGIACREVRVSYFDYAGTAPSPEQEQAMCTQWTQDRPVFAVLLSLDSPGFILHPCLDAAGVVALDAGGAFARDRRGLEELEHLVVVNSPDLTRGAIAQVDAHVRHGLLDSASRIGVLQYDEPVSTRTVDEGLTPALATYGLAIAERRSVIDPQDEAELGLRDQQVSNVVLQFKAAGVDRVIFVRGDGLALSFMTVAESQAYRPGYGLTTFEVPVGGTGGAPPAQLRGAHAAGWVPESDLAPSEPPSWGARDRCLDHLRDLGFEFSGHADRLIALAVCDAVWFVEAAMDAMSNEISADTFVDGVTRLGDGFESALVGPTRFGPGRRDGAAMYFDLAYDDACACWTRVGGPHLLPG
jgi:hypothetical protein